MTKILHDTIKLKISEYLQQTIKQEFAQDLALESIYTQIGAPPKSELGDYAFGCFILAKKLKLAPSQIAQKLESYLSQSDVLTAVKAMGPYLNLKCQQQLYGDEVMTTIINGTYFERQITTERPKTMVEYSQPNTHKELHVGHMRNLCLGKSLVELMKYCQIPVIATTFPGDVGTHVAKCLWYLKQKNQETPPEHHKGAWLGRLYSLANNLLEDERGTDKEDSNRRELTQILAELESGHGEYYELWKETRDWSIALMNDVYRWADVQFDSWYWESDVDSDSLKFAKELYEKGLLVKDQGAIGMDLSAEKLGFCMLIKSDGNGLYATKDVELARKKFNDYQIEKNIYVVDKRQSHHFKQVFKVLEKIGFENADKCTHLQYDFVELPDGAMSSRKGNIIPLQELIDKMQSKVINDYLERYRGQWNDAEIEHTAYLVARGAIHYGMLKMDPNKKIVFDMNEWLRLDGDSGPYIQYVHARILSLLEKLNFDPNKTVLWNCLDHQLEREILVKCSEFNQAVLTAMENYRPSHLCTYLYQLSKLFNSFYAECPMANAPSADLKEARLALSAAVAAILKQGVVLLGFEAPQKM